MLKRIILIGLAFTSSLSAGAQAAPSVKGSGMSLTAGGVFSVFNTDANTHPIEYGIGAYVDYNFFSYLGIEVEGRTVQFNQQDNIRQDTISGGLRYIYNRGKFAPYAKVLAGLGSADFPQGTYGNAPLRQHDTFTTVTVGGGLDYKITSHVYLRGDYEYQFWQDYGRGLNQTGFGTLNPMGFSIGASYKIF